MLSVIWEWFTLSFFSTSRPDDSHRLTALVHVQEHSVRPDGFEFGADHLFPSLFILIRI